MLDDNNLFHCAAVTSSTYASMAAFTAAANMYNSFYPMNNSNIDPINYFGSNEIKRERLNPKINVKLENQDLWKRFYSFGNEMIITKTGRRLFPNFSISVTELDPNSKYIFLLDIIPIDDNRYKYQESTWIISGKAEPHIYGRHYIHPDSPQTGAQWMKQSILFNKIKITNNPMQNSNQILLNSMHRYIPRIHIIQAIDDYSIRTGPLSTFFFDETIFIAVTAYQNDQIKNLKIDNNPFAKGFREPTHGKKTSKSLKRLQSNSSLNKTIKSTDNYQRLYKSDSSLLSSNTNSSIMDSTYINPNISNYEQNSDTTIFNFPSIYHQNSSSTIYNPAYSYIGSTPTYYHPTSIYQTNPTFF